MLKKKTKARTPALHSIPVYVILGLLESGKTRFLNHWLPELYAAEKKARKQGRPRLALLSCESGETELSPEAAGSLSCVRSLTSPAQLESFDWEGFVAREKPDCLIFEYNGDWPLEHLLASLPSVFEQRHFLLVQQAALADLQLQAMGGRLQALLQQADQLLLTGGTKEERRRARRQLRAFRPGLPVYAPESEAQLPSRFWHRFYRPRSSFLLGLGLALCGLWFLYLFRAWLYLPELAVVREKADSVLRSFLSLNLQILPYLVFAAFLSSAIQLAVNEGRILQLFRRRSWLAVPLSILVSLVTPICDCGLVPIVTRLLKKGASPAWGLFFFISSAALNPLVLASTFLAFPGRPTVVAWRVGISLTVALLSSGLLLLWLRRRSEILEDLSGLVCASGYLGRLNRRSRPLEALQAMLRHPVQELFTLLKGVLLGTFLSALAHGLLPPELWKSWASNPFTLWLVLLPAVTLLAICANANAFLAQSFSAVLPNTALLTYMVFGPLLDVKNVLLLNSGIGPRLTVRYVLFMLLLLSLVFVGLSLLPAGLLPSLGGLFK